MAKGSSSSSSAPSQQSNKLHLPSLLASQALSPSFPSLLPPMVSSTSSLLPPPKPSHIIPWGQHRAGGDWLVKGLRRRGAGLAGRRSITRNARTMALPRTSLAPAGHDTFRAATHTAALLFLLSSFHISFTFLLNFNTHFNPKHFFPIPLLLLLTLQRHQKISFFSSESH